MAKKTGEPRPFRVTLNMKPGHWDVDAVDEADAIAQVIQQTKSQRDKRNFTAKLRDTNPVAPSAPVPPIPGQ